jgi:branched-chain amino acid transport system ATP-binding protein
MPLLEINNVSVRFGGLRALSDFNFKIDPGELVGLIGPNGAGKTTAFNIVTGVYTPASGEIRLNGHAIHGQTPTRINHAGIARTFQNIRLFGDMSALDNVMAGFHRKALSGIVGAIARTPHYLAGRADRRERGMALLDTLGLAPVARSRASSLPYGDQRRLEIARALATSPRILLLDEPAAGMNPQEKLALMKLISLIREKFRVGIWLIEHDMKLVMTICQRVTVLDHGEVIAVGTPAEIQNNPRVIEAYLGQPAELK